MIFASLLAAFVLFYFFSCGRSGAQGLNVVFGRNGLQQLSYNGTKLEDTSRYPTDAFHIWHMKMTDLQGNVLTGEYGWGENNYRRSWDASTKRWIYVFTWGVIQVQYLVNGNNLNIVVTETNRMTSGVILDGAVIYPLVLHMPRLPNHFNNVSYPQLAYTTTGPGVTTADYGSGEVVAVVPDASKPLYSGFLPAGNGIAYTTVISGTTPDDLATFDPHFDRPVQPGQTDTFTLSLRFAPSGTLPVALAHDAYANWTKIWPPQLNWTDRRAIGTVYLASSPGGNVNHPLGYSNNPRRYFNDSNPTDFDVTTAAGLRVFQARILAQAAANVTNLAALGAQGVITWDIEGEQYPQDTSYVCSPNQIATVAPEMESVITDPKSIYHGMKLDDAYFKTMTDAGFKVGVCVRPQHFTLNSDGTAAQVTLSSSAAIIAELEGKIAFAHDRWGARLFYIDSTVDANGGALDPSIFRQVARSFPDSLLIPEETVPRDYAYTAPFQPFIFHGDTGTDPMVHAYYPNAFSAILINDVDPSLLATATAKLTASVHAGDLLMAHVDYAQANNRTVVSIYKAAGEFVPRTGSTPAASSISTSSSPQPHTIGKPILHPSPITVTVTR